MTEAPWLMPDAEAFVQGKSTVAAQRYDHAGFAPITETLIEEVPVSLEWNGRKHVVMMATPIELEAFAVGFSLTERIIETAAQILSIDIVPTTAGMGVLIQVPQILLDQTDMRERSRIGNSSCGLCGVRDMQAAMRVPDDVMQGQRFRPQAIIDAMQKLPQFQPVGTLTGAAHAAAAATPAGDIIMACEDAGRHNALDKLVGKMALQGMRPADSFLVLTSRASFEMVQKAAAAGFPMLCAISAPTGLAVRMAEQTGITLVAFARGQRFSCFSHPERIDHRSLPEAR